MPDDKNVYKLKKRCEKLSKILNDFSPDDIDKLRKSDLAFDGWIRNISDYLGDSNPYWRVHPLHPHIRCSINGEIEVAGHDFTIREFDGVLKVCYSNGRKKYSAPDLIMACFNPCPTKNRKEWKIAYKDRNYKNLKPSNLYWERVFVR